MPNLLRRQSRPVQHPIETYLQEINATPLLTADEERELAYRIENGDTEARDHMVRANLRLVVNIARRYAAAGLGLADAIAEGNLGLMRAVQGFDPSRAVRFSTYACYWIEQSIKRAVINTGKTIRLPTSMVELLTKWRRATAQLQEASGRAATEEEVAASMNMSRKKLAIVKQALRIHNATPVGDYDWSREESLTNGRGRAAGCELVEADDLRRALTLLDKLGGRDASVLRLRFGLGGEDPMTLQAIGDRLGLTRERVRQIEGAALDRLREGLEAA
jgi:RNA polymerase primary sigma factor